MYRSNRPRQSLALAPGFAVPIIAALFVACATITPLELEDARAAYTRASSGPAAQVAPADLHKAKTALDRAEQSFASDKGSRRTKDLAYIADRTAQIAEAHAERALAEKRRDKAKQDLSATQGELAKNAQGALTKSREELAEAQRGQAAQAQQAGAERTARADADRRAAASEQKAVEADQRTREANDALAKLAAKEEERGMVITLSGSVLFRTNDAVLLPAAMTRLDQVAAALVAKGHDVVVEGFTDSRGSQATNMNLSHRRAESVLMYLVGKGFPREKIQARGMGPDRPIAENNSAEGRANNRRVEIVIAKSNPGVK